MWRVTSFPTRRAATWVQHGTHENPHAHPRHPRKKGKCGIVKLRNAIQRKSPYNSQCMYHTLQSVCSMVNYVRLFRSTPVLLLYVPADEVAERHAERVALPPHPHVLAQSQVGDLSNMDRSRSS